MFEKPTKCCTQCGAPTAKKIPTGDNRERDICSQCDYVHYSNPKIICGALPIYEGKILLCKRAIQPRHGYWTLPAGFMENGETSQEGAERESLEEACAKMSELSLYAIFNIPSLSQVYMLYKGNLINGEHAPGEESLETKLFEISEIPWDQIAFRTITKTLKHFIEDSEKNNFPLHIEDLIYKAK